MVPVSNAPGAMGSGWYRGHGFLCADNSLSGNFCSPVWMLQTRRKEAKEEGWSDLDNRREMTDLHTIK